MAAHAAKGGHEGAEGAASAVAPRAEDGHIDTRRGRGAAWLTTIALVALFVAGTQAYGADHDEPDQDQVVRGGEVFQANCAACHGPTLLGGPGPGALDGGPIIESDISFVDLTMRTGRMPIVETSVGIRDDVLPDADREAVIAYLQEVWDLPGEIPEVGPGDAASGQELYVRNCAACHGAAADGGISGADVRVPPLTGLDEVAIFQGTRIGPFSMPAFSAALLDDEAVEDIAAYLQVADEAPRTVLGLQEVDQVGEAWFALALTGLTGVAVWIVARARRWSPHEPEGFHDVDPFEPR